LACSKGFIARPACNQIVGLLRKCQLEHVGWDANPRMGMRIDAGIGIPAYESAGTRMHGKQFFMRNGMQAR
jgi:hypothetical protein